MANTYEHTSVLSKVAIGGVTYYLKDADLRTIVDAYGTVVSKNYSDSLDASRETTVPTDKAVADYIKTAVAGLSGAMHFKGQVASLPASTDGYENGDVIVVTGGKEYVALIPETGTGSWIELGDETGHVYNTLKIAGIDLKDDISVAELQSALALKALAYAATASTTVDDYVNGIDNISYTPEGTISVATTSTETGITSTGKLTPAGTISIAKDTDNGTQISGSVTVNSVTVTPETKNIYEVTSVGSASHLEKTTSKFATAGLIGEVSDETLNLTAATTADAVNSITYTASVAPTLATDATSVMTGVKSTAATATFTGDKFAATFKGTAGDVSVSGKYDKIAIDNTNTKFTGTAATITPTLTKTTKKITVSPDNA